MSTDDDEVVERNSYSLKLEELKWQKQKFSIAMAAFFVLVSFVMISFWLFYGGNSFRNQGRNEMILQQRFAIEKVLVRQSELDNRIEELESRQSRSEAIFDSVKASLYEMRELIQSDTIRGGKRSE